MKKAILIFLFTLNFTLIYSQFNQGKISYKLESKDHSLKKGNGILYFNNKESIYIINNEKELTQIQKISDGSTVHPSNTNDSIANKPRFIYYDAKNKIFYNNIINNNIEMIIKDTVSISWNIKKDFKKILGFNCQKAIGKLNDKNYEVWFSKDLKYPYGPIKINGLNGLILELHSDDLKLSIIAENISLNDKNISNFINNFNDKYDYSNTISRSDYDKQIINYIKQTENTINNHINDETKKIKFSDLNCKDCNN